MLKTRAAGRRRGSISRDSTEPRGKVPRAEILVLDTTSHPFHIPSPRMLFLAPFFLLGALAISLPILAHLRRHTSRDRIPFSSLLFLREMPQPVTRRSRLDNLWLLLLRCLALLLLACAFGRPLLRSAAPALAGPPPERTVILLDTSASMRAPGRWPAALARAEAEVRAQLPGSSLAVLTFAQAPGTLSGFDEWQSHGPDALLARLRELSPGLEGTALAPALQRAAELLRAEGSGGTIVLISDLQEGSAPEALLGMAWPEGVHVRLETPGAPPHDNASIAWLPRAAAEDGQSARFRVTNSPASRTERFQVRWAAPGSPASELVVPAGQSRTIRLPMPGTDHATLEGDGAAWDNTAWVVPPRTQRVPVLYLGTENAEDSAGMLFYLQRAWGVEIAGRKVEVIARAPGQAIDAAELESAGMLILAPGAIAAADTARAFAESGRTVLLPLASVDAGPVLASVLGRPPIEITEGTPKDHALLARIDLQHPLLAPFADPRYSDWTKIPFWHYRRIPAGSLEGANVLASFDSGDPALVEFPLGKGRVVLLSTTWRPADSQLALSTKFIPLLGGMLEQSARLQGTTQLYDVGDAIPLGGVPSPRSVRLPDGTEVPVAGQTSFTQTVLPGSYSIMPGGDRFAINVAARESRTEPLSPERLASLGVPLTPRAATPSAAASKAATELEGSQKLWRWLIGAALVVLAIEGLLSSRAGRASREVAIPGGTA